MTRPSAVPPIALATALIAIALAIGQWRSVVLAHQGGGVKAEKWARVKQKYPLAPEPSGLFTVSSGLIDAVVRANPFSHQRRHVPVAEDTGPVQPVEPDLPPAQFIYKGRVQLGASQRAVVEEINAGKTYFLELGQEVAGFKVLDIAEKQVVLSDPQTGEEVVVSLASPGGS